MITTGFALFWLLQTELGDAPELRSPPRPACECEKAATPRPDIVFKGVVVDAELRLDASGRDVEPEQATIFRVVRIDKGKVESPARVWHLWDIENCGVAFEYGRTYIVRARKAETRVETNVCLQEGESAR